MKPATRKRKNEPKSSKRHGKKRKIDKNTSEEEEEIGQDDETIYSVLKSYINNSSSITPEQTNSSEYDNNNINHTSMDNVSKMYMLSMSDVLNDNSNEIIKELSTFQKEDEQKQTNNDENYLEDSTEYHTTSIIVPKKGQEEKEYDSEENSSSLEEIETKNVKESEEEEEEYNILAKSVKDIFISKNDMKNQKGDKNEELYHKREKSNEKMNKSGNSGSGKKRRKSKKSEPTNVSNELPKDNKKKKIDDKGLWNKAIKDTKKLNNERKTKDHYSSVIHENSPKIQPKTILLTGVNDNKGLKKNNIKLFEHIDENNASAISEKIKKTISEKIPLSGANYVNEPNLTHLSSLVGLCETITEDYKKTNSNHKYFEKPSIEIPILSRAYIKDFLREPINAYGERPCVAGDSCTSITLGKNYRKQTGNKDMEPFILRELLLPRDLKKMAELFVLHPEERPIKLVEKHFPEKNFCILCKRFITSLNHLKNQVEKPVEQIQTHGNLFDIHGEYNLSAALVCGQNYSGLLRPIVRYDITDYAPYKYDVFSLKFESKPSIFKKTTKFSDSDDKKIGQINNMSVGDVDDDYYNNLENEMAKDINNTGLILKSFDEIKLSNASDETIQKYTVNGWTETPVIVYNQLNDPMADDSTNLAERLVDKY
jgi:hypothetical protein